MRLAGSPNGGEVYTRLKANAGGKGMFHLSWYVLIGLVL
jgi:hypothetical protein